MKKISHLILVFICCFLVLPAHAILPECKIDRLKITKIETRKPAKGLAPETISIMNEVIDYAITWPIGAGVKKAAGKLWGFTGVALSKKVKDRAEFLFDAGDLIGGALLIPSPFESLYNQMWAELDGELSGQDDLIVRINGTRVVPGYLSWPYYPMVVGSTYPNTLFPKDISVSFFGSATIQLIEYDSGSGNDNLGEVALFDETDVPGVLGSDDPADPAGLINTDTLTLFSNTIEPGEDDEGAIYDVTYTVEPGMGVLSEIPERLLCDFNECRDAREPVPSYQWADYDGLKDCPTGYDYNNTIVENGNSFYVCELYPDVVSPATPEPCGATFEPLPVLGVGPYLTIGFDALNDGDIIVLKPRKMDSENSEGRFLASTYGQYLSRCTGCIPGDITLSDTAFVHILDPNRSAANWVVKKLDNGKIMLRAMDTGKFLSLCTDCVPGMSYPFEDSGQVESTNPNNVRAQFTLEPEIWLGAGFFTLRSFNDKLLTPCAGCVPDQNNINLRYSTVFLPDSGATPYDSIWEIKVRRKDPVNPAIYSADLTFDGEIKIKSNEVWQIHNSQTLTINSGATLIVENGGSIVNHGIINNKGTIVVGDLGQINNENGGVIYNDEIIKIIDGVINNKSGGVIDNSQANYVQNGGAIINNGAIYAPYDRFYGANPTINQPVKGFHLGPDFTGEFACAVFNGIWDNAAACSVTNAWVKENTTLHIARNVSLIINGTMTNDGVIKNYGEVDNANGNLRVCGNGTLQGNAPTSLGNIETPCVVSAEAQQCADFGGTWNQTIPNTCDITSNSTVLDGQVLTIRDGYTWNVSGILNNYGSLHIEANGELHVPGGTITNNKDNVSGYYGVITNYGLISIDYDDNIGIQGYIENYTSIYNHGSIVNGSGASGYIFGSGGFIDNFCGSVYTVVRYPNIPRNEYNSFSDLLCPPLDFDNDGTDDLLDAFPFDATETTDTDGDGVGDVADVYPNDPAEWANSDKDAVGDNADAFPDDPLETVDTDGDGVGDNADAFVDDPFETVDTDGDSVGDNGDAFPDDINESRDSDFDGVGDNTDAFPNDPDNSRLISVDAANAWILQSGMFMANRVPDPLPGGASLVNGLVNFKLSGGTVGTNAVLTFTYDAPIDPALVWWKYGSTADNDTPHWYVFAGAVISGNTVTLTVTDGGAGDDDLFANGSITDPGGLGMLPQVSDNTTVTYPDGGGSGGTMNLWFLFLLFSMRLLELKNKRKSKLL